ncbi:MAG: WD40/YVTN/BNR-like repeat-containing protein [Bryobacteraceae bacterium]
MTGVIPEGEGRLVDYCGHPSGLTVTTIFLPTRDGLLTVAKRYGGWKGRVHLEGNDCWAIALDPSRSEHVYCGTYGRGLWQSFDGCETWRQISLELSSDRILSLAVSPLDGSIWTGTEPSALHCSEDLGKSWHELSALRQLPSAPTWSYPPRPYTSHVRCIVLDPNDPERVLAGIEQGGVMRSLDRGKSWEDHNPAAEKDPHTMTMHPTAPGRIYEAGGGGYAESFDGGGTWSRSEEGIRQRYLFGLAVDPGDPETIVVSASPSPFRAHNPVVAYCTVYRRVAGETWKEAREGLPGPHFERVFVMAAHDAEPHVFYLSTHSAELFRSTDAGKSWDQIFAQWPSGYSPQDVHGIAVAEVQ